VLPGEAINARSPWRFPVRVAMPGACAAVEASLLFAEVRTPRERLRLLAFSA
jgi:hypothetical protein